jgi:hypothetical protein
MSLLLKRADAIRYLGVTESLFRTLKAEGIVKPVRKGWYSRAQIEQAVERMEKKDEAKERWSVGGEAVDWRAQDQRIRQNTGRTRRKARA